MPRRETAQLSQLYPISTGRRATPLETPQPGLSILKQYWNVNKLWAQLSKNLVKPLVLSISMAMFNGYHYFYCISMVFLWFLWPFSIPSTAPQRHRVIVDCTFAKGAFPPSWRPRATHHRSYGNPVMVGHLSTSTSTGDVSKWLWTSTITMAGMKNEDVFFLWECWTLAIKLDMVNIDELE